MRLTVQVIVSLLLVAGVMWAMWRLPRRGDMLMPWGPPLALLSAWMGLIALAASVALWWVAAPDGWLPIVFFGFYPGAVATGVLLLWIYRGLPETGPDALPMEEEEKQSIAAQRTQAWVGIGLGMLGVVLGYVFVMTQKTPFTPVGI